MAELNQNKHDLNWLRQHCAWFAIFLPLAWCGHIGLGMALGVFGPTQPYLAKNVNVNIDTINFIWTGRSIGFMFGSVVTGLTYRRYLRKTWQKLLCLAVAEAMSGMFMVLTPWMGSFPGLIALCTVWGLFLGCFDTADNGLMVYMFGPRMSRPFSQSIHAFVGVGFVLGSLLVQPFLPEETEEGGDQNVCGSLFNATTANENISVYEPEFLNGIPKINWAYVIIGSWQLMVALGMLILALTKIPMPCYVVEEHLAKTDSQQLFTRMKFWKSLIAMIYVYYIISCGVESFFQAMAYTYALCGPLELTTHYASALNTVYYAAFVTGRLSGIVISRFLRPRTIIFVSILCCLGASILLAALGDHNMYWLYVGTAIMGYAISVQFSSGISWTAHRFDVTGSLSFIFFIGGYTAHLSFPPMAGTVFTSRLGPIGIFYLAIICNGVLLLHFSLMNFLAKFRTKTKVTEEEKKEDLYL